MNKRAQSVLEYDKIRLMLLEHVSFSASREMAEQLTPQADLEEVQRLLQATEEARGVYQRRGNVPLGGLHDIRAAAVRAQLGGSLSGAELNDIADTIAGGRRLGRFLAQYHEAEPIDWLMEQVSQISLDRDVEEEIRRCIDDEGLVRDQASPELRRVRTEIRSTQARLRDRLESYLRDAKWQKMLQENIVTMRNDRYCLAVRAENRSAFGGIVHDQSASGATVFVEPAAVVEMNNAIRALQAQEEREVEKALIALSARVGAVGDELRASVGALAQIDFAFAKAKLAHRMRASLPSTNRDGYVRLKSARHPLLARESAVPIGVELGGDAILLIITGPNTGGKTVTLKTIGLLTLMAQSGLHIPAEEGSTIAVFDEVFADIGDEQSIEQSLSTFSSHMTHIVDILGRAHSNTLVLLDELGAGTDPTEGAALAVAILENLRRRAVRTAATTHYSELKTYAFTEAQALNASVEFDVESLRPTYRLLIGTPGRSNAFAIARRLGLPDEIVQHARSRLTAEDVRVEDLIHQLETSRLRAERDEREVRQAREEADRLREELRHREAELNEQRETILSRAREDARKALRKADREAAAIIQELRQLAQDEKANIKDHQLVDLRRRLGELAPHDEAVGTATSPASSVQAGDTVRVRSIGQKGQVLDVSGEQLQVQIGVMKMKVRAGDVEFVSRGEAPEREVKTVTMVKRATSSDVKLELDVRGTTVEEAELEIDKYLDNAILGGLGRVSIIHGKGTGALRAGIQQYLREHPRVASFRAGGQNEGGSGVTVVELR